MAVPYNFEDGVTSKYLDGLGWEKVPVAGAFVPILEEDFNKIIQEGRAQITEKEAFVLDEQGKKHPVFFYKKSYRFYHKEQRGAPKFHIKRCRTIENIGENQYAASNQKEVTIINSNTSRGDQTYTLELTICSNCRDEVITAGFTTAQYHDKIKSKYQQELGTKVDFDGYTMNWSLISKDYRKRQNYICEECGIDLSGPRKYLDVHHINGNKRDNHDDNLRCLCKLCHYSVDTNHEMKFAASDGIRQLKRFVKQFEQEIERRNYTRLEHFRSMND